jgi:hypothetical protein
LPEAYLLQSQTLNTSQPDRPRCLWVYRPEPFKYCSHGQAQRGVSIPDGGAWHKFVNCLRSNVLLGVLHTGVVNEYLTHGARGYTEEMVLTQNPHLGAA